MHLSPSMLVGTASWAVTGLGLGFGLWSGLGAGDTIRRVRLFDFGVLLIFGAALARLGALGRPLVPIDWAFALLSPLFVTAALWRLSTPFRAKDRASRPSPAHDTQETSG